MSKLTFLEKLLNGKKVEWKKLGDVADISNTGVDKKINDNENFVTLLNYMDIFRNNYINNNIPKMRVTASEKKINNCNALYGDIFITPSSEKINEIGIASVITEDLLNTCYSYHVMRLRLKENNFITSCFIRYCFESNILRSQILKNATGLTRFGLTKGKFASLQIPIPPLSVQKEIVKILDSFTQLTTQLTTELTSRKKQYTYYRNKLLTFKSGTTVEWKKLGDVCKVQRGASPRPISNYITSDSNGIPWIKIGDTVAGSKYVNQTAQKITPEGSKKSRLLKKGNFIISNSMSFGRPYILNINGCIHDGWAAISEFEKYLNSDYLYHFLSSTSVQNYWISKLNSGSVSNLNADIIKTLSIPIPPLSKQKEIVSILDKFNTLTNSISEGLPREIELRQKQYEYYRNLLLNFPKTKG